MKMIRLVMFPAVLILIASCYTLAHADQYSDTH